MATHNGLTLEESCSIGHLVLVMCGICRKRIIYTACDLRDLYGPRRNVFDLPFRCEHCKQRDCIRIDVRLPDDRDLGKLVIRRPAGVKRVQLWQEVTLK